MTGEVWFRFVSATRHRCCFTLLSLVSSRLVLSCLILCVFSPHYTAPHHTTSHYTTNAMTRSGDRTAPHHHTTSYHIIASMRHTTLQTRRDVMGRCPGRYGGVVWCCESLVSSHRCGVVWCVVCEMRIRDVTAPQRRTPPPMTRSGRAAVRLGCVATHARAHHTTPHHRCL